MGNTFSFNCGECQCRIKTSFQRLEQLIWEDIPITTSSNLIDPQASPDADPSVLGLGGYPLRGHVKLVGKILRWQL